MTDACEHANDNDDSPFPWHHPILEQDCTLRVRRARTGLALVTSIKLTARMRAVLFSSVIVLLLASCEVLPPLQEGAVDSSDAAGTVSDSDRALAERSIYSALTQGIDRYLLAPGDVLRFIFMANPEAQQSSYVIGVRDKLRIEFYYQKDATRTVVVRPDGRITLPAKGDVVAAGLTAEKLAEHIRKLYQDMYRDPVVTVSVEEYSSPFTELNDSLKTAQEGRARQVVIAPDGFVYLPLLPPIKAGGKTVGDLQAEVNRLYAERAGGMSISLGLERVSADRVFVFGEIRNPGVLTLARPQTALQVIATAGGSLPTGAMDRVKVLSWTSSGESRVHTLNLEAVFDGAHNDMLVPPNTVLYVPPTTITKVNRFIDQYIKQLFLFNGISGNVIYELRRRDSLSVP